MTHPLITQDHIDQYQRDGATLVRGLFRDQLELLRAGVVDGARRRGGR